MAREDRKKGDSMVAPHPPADGRLHLVEDLAAGSGMPAHAIAGMCRANGWMPGKQLTVAEFEAARAAYVRRPMGSGRI